jgi:2-polyprenyl-6-methoxyphenol hydroxylase-like FAD-dependent oxidoreductase
MTSLLMALPPDCVRTGSRVVAFEETAGDVRVELADGNEVRGDLLVGADGLRSATRERQARQARRQRLQPERVRARHRGAPRVLDRLR